MSIAASTIDIQTDVTSSTLAKNPTIKFLVGIEDKPYFHWQLPILAESLCNKIPAGWELLVVISNNHAPLSEHLSQILTTYELTYFTAPNHAATQAVDFSENSKGYLPWNKIQPLAAVAEHVNNDDLVCLMDTDIFLFQDINPEIFPTGNALSENWLINKEPFLSTKEDPNGIHLQTLLKALGCPQPFKPGGVFVFLTGETVKNQKFVQDCFRFTQILYLAGRIADLKKRVWMVEMPCYALALTANGISYDLINPPEFGVHFHKEEIISPGSFYHYYCKRTEDRPGAFYESPWCKQDFEKSNLLEAPLDDFYAQARTDQEKYFFELAKTAKQKLGLDSVSNQQPIHYESESQEILLPEEPHDEPKQDTIISSPYVQIDHFLTASELEQLQNYAIQHREVLITPAPSPNGTDSSLSAVLFSFPDTGIGRTMINRIRQVLPEIFARLDISTFQIKEIEAELSTSDEEDSCQLHNDSSTAQTESRKLTFLYHFHHDAQPSPSGKLLLYDLKDKDGITVKADSFTAFEPRSNSIVFFPSHCFYEIRSIRSCSSTSNDSCLTVKGWIRRQRKRLPPTQIPDSILEWAKTSQLQPTQKNGNHAV